jgi:DNA helicase-2/ATP-dependent DNA helicase PcrA
MQVLASAGSGKTRVLTERVRHIVRSTKRDRVIALTFTNKAAEEMLQRLSDLEDIEERCWISTIHSVAQRVVSQYGHTIGLPSDLQIFERDQDRKAIFLQSMRESGVDIDAYLEVDDINLRKSRSQIVQGYMERFSIIKRELLTEDEVRARYTEDGFWSTYSAYQQALIESGGIDFDDILVYAHRILMEQSWCGDVYRAKYKHVCVDEAQDLNRAQYEFIKAFCGEQIRSIFMVGDPNQMIYGFNGSSHKFLCELFLGDYAPACYTLSENYRSSQAVVELANKLKPGSQVVTDFALRGDQKIAGLESEEAEAEWICQSIKNILALGISPEIEGDISLGNMVVIARNRFVFMRLEECLAKHSIPYSLKKGERGGEPNSTFGKTLDLAIRLKLNPRDWVDGKKLCSALKIEQPAAWGGGSLLMDLSRDASAADIPFAELQSELLAAIHQIDVDEPNIPKLHSHFHRKLTELGKQDTPQGDEEIELSLLELDEFRESWTCFKRKGLGESLLAFRNAMALGQLSGEYDPKGLTLSTVHTMKGLEKDIVFLMGMCEGVFPDYRAKLPHEIDEERNSAFVAVTRSRRWIYITYPQYRKMPWGDIKPQQPSRFVKQMML